MRLTRLVHEQEETAAMHRTLNPVWEVEFAMEIADMEGWLSVTVFDEDRLTKNDEIGSTFVRLSDVISASQKSHLLAKLQVRPSPKPGARDPEPETLEFTAGNGGAGPCGATEGLRYGGTE